MKAIGAETVTIISNFNNSKKTATLRIAAALPMNKYINS